MNGLPIPNETVSPVRKDSARTPLIDLAELDRLAEEELRHKAFVEEENRRQAHQAKLAESTPKPVKAKPHATKA